MIPGIVFLSLALTAAANFVPPSEHSPDIDHERFLGKDLAEEMDDLPLQDTLRRLGNIFDRIDTNRDGVMSIDEMVIWMRNVTDGYVKKDTDSFWDDRDGSEGNGITWEAYEKTFRATEKGSSSEAVKKLLAKDKKRWGVADLDKDGVLSRDELAPFLHPEQFESMRPVVAEEILEEFDTNNDGMVDMDEYLVDMGFDPKSTSPEKLSQMEVEKKLFNEDLDVDQDGKLNFKEFMDWIAPTPQKFLSDEAEHLVNEADTNRDGSISKDEMLEHHSVFAGSQLTDYGDHLRHDEL